MILPASRLPEGRGGQVIAVGAPLCILIAVVIGILGPAWRWYDGRQQLLAAEQEQVAGILAQANMLPQLRQQAAAAQASGDTQVLLAGNSDAIAAANLQSDLAGLAAASGASLASTEVLPAQMSGGLRQMGIAVEVTADWPALTELLVAIESARPRMIVNDLSISPAAFGIPGTSLQASFSVLAFRNAGTPRATSDQMESFDRIKLLAKTKS
jgi:general secretion pathway protein M